MTVFQTPEPISVSLEFGIGDLRLVASDSHRDRGRGRADRSHQRRGRERGKADPGRVRVGFPPREGPEELAPVDAWGLRVVASRSTSRSSCPRAHVCARTWRWRPCAVPVASASSTSGPVWVTSASTRPVR